MIARLPELVNADESLVRRGRYANAAFLVEIGEKQHLVEVRQGRVESVSTGPLVMPRWTFALRASPDVWGRFWQPMPPPGFNDLFAMMKSRQMRIEGDLHPFMANLLYFKELLAAPRRLGGLR